MMGAHFLMMMMMMMVFPFQMHTPRQGRPQPPPESSVRGPWPVACGPGGGGPSHRGSCWPRLEGKPSAPARPGPEGALLASLRSPSSRASLGRIPGRCRPTKGRRRRRRHQPSQNKGPARPGRSVPFPSYLGRGLLPQGAQPTSAMAASPPGPTQPLAGVGLGRGPRKGAEAR